MTAAAVEQRLYDAIVQAAYHRPIGAALADVQEMRLARSHPAEFVAAVERFEAATECGEAFCFA